LFLIDANKSSHTHTESKQYFEDATSLGNDTVVTATRRGINKKQNKLVERDDRKDQE